MEVSKSTNYLETVGMSLDEWIKLSPEDKEKTLKAAFKDKEPDELQEAVNAMAEDIGAEKESLKELESKLRQQLRHDSGLTDGQRNEVKKWLNRLDELEAELKSFEKNAKFEAAEVKNHHFDITEQTDINVSEATMKVDGENYTYTISNSGGNPFGEDAEKKPLEGVTSDGTATGKVIKDANLDGVKNYQDIEHALKEAENARILEAKKIFINTPEDYTWELAAADKSTGNYTFKVTNEKGESSYVTFENAKDAVFVFKSGIDSGDIGKIKDKWPEALLKNCYWENDDKSFFERLGKESQETTKTDNNLNVIEGYVELKNSFENSFKKYAGSTADNKSKLQSAYNQSIDDLYGIINNTDPDKGSQLQAYWESNNKKWKDAGLSTSDIVKLYQMLLFSLKEKGGSNYDLLVKNHLPAIEDSIKDLGQNPRSVALILYIEMELSGASYGGPSALDNIDNINGKLTNPAKLDVIAELKKMYQQAGVNIPATITDLEKSIADNLTQEEKIEATGGYYQISEDEYNKLMDSTKSYGDKYAADIADGVYEEELGALLGAMVEMINKNGENQPVEQIRATLIGFIDGLEEKYQDEAAATIIQLLHDKAPQLFDKLTASGGFCKKMWGYIDNGGNEPENYYQCREWLTGENSVTNLRYLDDTANGFVDGFEEGYNWGKSVLGDNPAGAALGVVSGAVDGIIQGAKGVVDDLADAGSDVIDEIGSWF